MNLYFWLPEALDLEGRINLSDFPDFRTFRT
jgi:hypothetical protein